MVEENSLNRSIYVLRKALGESVNGTKYIETVPKRGYRFVAGVIEVQPAEADLILEHRTSAEIITVEEEEITEAGQFIRDAAVEAHDSVNIERVLESLRACCIIRVYWKRAGEAICQIALPQLT